MPLYLSDAKVLEWHRLDPPEPWECAREVRIRERTGLAQPYLQMPCRGIER